MNVAVLGGGIMGSGIAQVAAMGGHHVSVLDIGEAQLDGTRSAIEDSLTRLVRKDSISAADREATLSRLGYTTALGKAVGGADAVIEAVPEQLELKQELMTEVAALAPGDCLLATNTSQLAIGAIGANLGEAAERLVGMHFFNPPVMMSLVELIPGERTSADSLEHAQSLAHSFGKETVLCRRDLPGFITTRCSVILRLECLRMLEEGVATPEDIDKALRLGLNHPMGPLELGDLVGLDTFLQCADGLAEAHGERFEAPSVA